jgi:hypothetical protein
LYGPFVILFQQNGTDQPDDGRFVGEDADDVGAPLDLAVQSFERIGCRILSKPSSRSNLMAPGVLI